MKTVIYKSQIALGEHCLNLPYNAKILSFGLDGEDRLSVWWTQGIDEPRGNYIWTFNTFYTGEPFDETLKHKFLGTCTRNQLVYHCYYTAP